MLADHRRKLEAIELRHVDVEQDDGNFRPQQAFQRLTARAGRDQALAKRTEDRFIAQKLSRLVVDQKNVDLVAFLHNGALLNDAATYAAPQAVARC
jgi:hypothetical protein